MAHKHTRLTPRWRTVKAADFCSIQLPSENRGPLRGPASSEYGRRVGELQQSGPPLQVQGEGLGRGRIDICKCPRVPRNDGERARQRSLKTACPSFRPLGGRGETVLPRAVAHRVIEINKVQPASSLGEEWEKIRKQINKKEKKHTCQKRHGGATLKIGGTIERHMRSGRDGAARHGPCRRHR